MLKEIGVVINPNLMEESESLHSVLESRLDLVNSVALPPISIEGATNPQRWIRMSPSEYSALESYCSQIYELTSQNPTTKDLDEMNLGHLKINADIESLTTHIRHMQAQFRQLHEYKSFRDLLPNGTTTSYLDSIALIHDFSRFVFNGPLRDTDLVAEHMQQVYLPGYPNEHLHSIRWLTGETDPPTLDINNLDEYAIPYIVKAIDTLGKPGRDPKTYFSDPSGYVAWVKFQQETRRFPLHIPSPHFDGAMRMIDVDEYTQKDKDLTLMGVEVIEAITGVTFIETRNEALRKMGITNL